MTLASNNTTVRERIRIDRVDHRDCVSAFVSFHEDVQCTIDHTGCKPKNVWSGVEHLGIHDHGECGDPWSEL